MTHALLTALQWNCRSFSSAKTILTSKVKQLRPAFLLLQETLDTPKISGYDAFVNPSIPRKGATPGYAAILVDASIPAAQLQVPASNSNMHEVVAIVAQPPHAKKIILVSAYYQPYSSSTGTGPFTWLQHLINTNPNTPILVGGDFNAHHTAWGYSTNSARGTKLVELTEILNLQLMNDIIYPTRIGLHPSQKDTTPDLTWASPGLTKSWVPYSTTWGSDHLPILIKFRGKRVRYGRNKKQCTHLNWTTFRDRLLQYDSPKSLETMAEIIRNSSAAAVETITCDEESPT